MLFLSRAFGMTGEVWERHANPWSVWTRFPILPAMVLVLMLRDVLGWAVAPVLVALVLWTWLNPRAFPPPASTRSWASRAVMGERVWLRRRRVPIPRHHHDWARFLSLLPLLGLPPLLLGVIAGNWWLAFGGTAVVLLAKLWFLDRMVRLYDEMAAFDDGYASWLR